MKSSKTRDKYVVANKIQILHALKAAEKNNIPECLKYSDEGHMYFSCVELLPFLEEVNFCVKSVTNEISFMSHGNKLVRVAIDSMKSTQDLKDSFMNVLAKCFSHPEELNSTAVSTL